MKSGLIVLMLIFGLGNYSFGQTKKISMKSRSASFETFDLNTLDNFGLGCRQMREKLKPQNEVDSSYYDYCFCELQIDTLLILETVIDDSVLSPAIFIGADNIINQTEIIEEILVPNIPLQEVCPVKIKNEDKISKSKEEWMDNLDKDKKESGITPALIYILVIISLFGLTKVEFK